MPKSMRPQRRVVRKPRRRTEKVAQPEIDREWLTGLLQRWEEDAGSELATERPEDD